MALLEAIARFVDVFNQEDDKSGTLTLLTEKRAVPGELLPSGELRTFYETVDVDGAVIGNVFLLDIASLNKLPRYQEGWRWVYDTDPAGIEDTEYWHSSWLVFGYRNADAVFAKLREEKSPVFGSVEKAEEYQLATSLESFLTIMAACMTMVRDEFQYETKLEDFTVKPEVIDRTREIVTQHESPEITDRFIAFFFE